MDRNTLTKHAPTVWVLSPPSRGRGSKLLRPRRPQQSRLSPPSRGRGSKHDGSRRGRFRWRRLLHGGVDRNKSGRASRLELRVASFTGAWIETDRRFLPRRSCWSPPSRGRGSKQHQRRHAAVRLASPPSRGRGSKRQLAQRSRLLPGRLLHGGRGSKHILDEVRRAVRVSPPSRGRGSKHGALCGDDHDA